MAQPFEVGPGGGQVGPDGGEVGPSILGPNATGDVTQAAAAFSGSAEETFTGTATVEQAAATVTGTAVIISGAVTVTQAAARVRGGFGSVSFPVPAAAGAPTYPINLWRGQVVAVDADRDQAMLHLVLTCEDYNRLYPLAAVGAPTGPPDGNNVVGGDGTVTWVDPGAFAFGDGSGLGDGSVYRFLVSRYWPGGNDGTYTDVHQLNADYSDPTSYDWQTGRTFLGSVLDEFMAGAAGPYAAYWRDADKVHHWTRLGPTGEVSEFAIPAPFYLATDQASWTSSTVPANIRVTRDSRNRRRRGYTNGGTPDSSRFTTNTSAPLRAGDAYIPAQGAQTADDALRIGEWHLGRTFTQRIRGTAKPLPHQGIVGYHGWRIGQLLCLTDAELSRLVGIELAATPTYIQSVDGELVGPGPGLTISLDGSDLTTASNLKVEWRKLKFNNVLGGVGSATIELAIWDPDEIVTIAELAEVLITEDGTSDISYILGWGDAPAGSFTRRSLLVDSRIDYTHREGLPVNDFLFLVGDPGIRSGQSCVIVAQAWDAVKGPKRQAGISHIWGIEQDGDSYSLNPAEGTAMLTDTNGQSAVTMSRDDSGTPSTEYLLTIDAVPLD